MAAATACDTSSVPGLADPAQHFARVVGVERAVGLTRDDLTAVDIERVGPAQLRADLGDRTGKGGAVVGPCEIDHRLVVEGCQPTGTDLCIARFFRPFGPLPLGGDGRVLQQALDLGILGKALAQEGFVGGVLQQAAHQVAHAGNHVAVGAVQADAAGHLEDALADRFGHAVQHLEFVARFRHAQFLGHLHDRRDGADVVGGAGEVADPVVFQDHPRLALEGGIALGLDRPDRDLPAVLLGLDRLVIPVGTFHQADRDLRILLPGPGQQVGQVLVRVLQVGLQHDADVGIVAVFQFQAAIQLEDDLLVAVGLHVDAEESADFDGLGRDAAQLLQHGRHRAFEVLGIGQGEEGGRLDGDVDPRGVPPVQRCITAVYRAAPSSPAAPFSRLSSTSR